MNVSGYLEENQYTVVLITDNAGNVLYENPKYQLTDIDQTKETTEVKGITYITNQVENQGIIYYITSIEELNGPDFEENVMIVAQHLEVGIALLKNGKVLFRNEVLKSILHLPENLLYDKPWEHLQKVFGQRIQELMKNDQISQQEILLDFVEEYKKWLLITKTKRIIGEDVYFVFTIQDINDIKLREIKYNQQQEYLSNIIESMFEAIIVLDKDNRISIINPEAQNILGVTEDIISKPIEEYLQIYDSDGKPLPYRTLNNYKSNDVELETLDGVNHYINLRISNITGEAKEYHGKIISFFEIGEEKKREKEVLYLTYHDVLTGLYNRTFFEEQIKIIDNNRKLPLSIILGDVNGLKLTNDIFGHEAGDALLKQIARVLKSICRQDDIISRWGGDEFIILLPNTTENQVYMIMNRIMAEIEKIYTRHEVTSILPSLSLGYGVKVDSSQDIYDAIKVAENNMYKRKMVTNSSMYSTIITTMTNALYEHSSETEAHANRLYELCFKIAQEFHLSASDLSDLELFSKLHDIGKIGIPDEILNKPTELTEEERQIMNKHPEIGFRIASSAQELKGIAKYILAHHEKYDGTGYPKKLKGSDIPLISRILSVVDAYDAMTHDRPYRKAMSKEEAIQELDNNAGTQFDPSIVAIFKKLVQ